MDDGQVQNRVCLMLLSVAGQLGASRLQILSNAGVDERALADPDGYIPLDTHRRVGAAILELIPGRSLVALAASLATPATFGLVGRLAQTNETLRETMADLVRYQQLIIVGARLQLERTPGGARLVASMPPAFDELHFPTIALFAVWVSVGRQLTQTEWRPRAVSFALSTTAGEASSLIDQLGVEPRFVAERHTMELDHATLDLPVVGSRRDRGVMLRAYADSLMVDLGLAVGVSADVVRQLVDDLPRGVVRQDGIARSLGMSSRTLSRRLKDEGATFGQLMDDVRCKLSLRYLRDASLSVHEVAFLLGYTEPSTFFRAFKRWTGLTPRKWRASNR